jgi:2-polyprenyl-3-methyl-5-hydroxy-6-metoxy-1,4-benzoquinol methylase
MRPRAAIRPPDRFGAVSLDAVRDFWNRRPCNIRHSPKPVGTREYFDEVEKRRYFVEPHIPRFAEFPRWAGKRVLEIGCGIGTDTINFARAGALVTAVDLSEESIALARERARVFGVEDRITFYAADAENLSKTVPPEPYDLVYSFGVIHHTPHPERVIAEIRERFVHDDTVLKVMLYHRRSWKVFWIVATEGKGAFWNLEELVARNSEAQTGCPVTYTYTRREAEQLLEGFEVLDSQVDFIFPYRVEDYVEYRYVKNWQFRGIPAPVFRWLQRRAGWHLCLTANVATTDAARHGA